MFLLSEQRARAILFFVVFTIAFVAAFYRVHVFWNEGEVKSTPGDWNYYVQACNHIPVDHPVVPLMLRGINFFVRNPDLTILSLMVTGYTLMFALSFIVPFRFKYHLVASLLSFFIVASTEYKYLTPTALKNIWAINFLLVTLLLFPKIDTGRWHLKASTVAMSIVTFLTHTIPFFALLPVTLCHLINSEKNRKFYFATTSLLILAIFTGLFLLPQLNRLSKLNAVINAFITNPANVILYNIHFVFVDVSTALHVSIFQITIVISTLSFMHTRKFEPMLSGLFFTYTALFFLGPPTHQAFTGRFHETGIPIIAILYAYALTTGLRFLPYRFPQLKTCKDRVRALTSRLKQLVKEAWK